MGKTGAYLPSRFPPSMPCFEVGLTASKYILGCVTNDAGLSFFTPPRLTKLLLRDQELRLWLSEKATRPNYMHFRGKFPRDFLEWEFDISRRKTWERSC